MRKRRFAWAVPMVLGVLAALYACSGKQAPGQLLLVVQTDMAPPDDIDTIYLQVTKAPGTVLFDSKLNVGAATAGFTKLPATLAILAEPSTPITVKVAAYAKGELRMFRETTTTVPSARQATLQMPVQFLCNGLAKIDPATMRPMSTCPEGNTCVAGECVKARVDEPTLVNYTAAEVFGGGSGAGDGVCFDTAKCFAGAAEVIPDANGCTIPSGATNVALKLAKGGAIKGICDDSGSNCYVPLDKGPEGWKDVGGKIKLPNVVCALVTSKTASVVVSTGCDTKTEKSPTCGPWSSVASKVAAPKPANPVSCEGEWEISILPGTYCRDGGTTEPDVFGTVVVANGHLYMKVDPKDEDGGLNEDAGMVELLPEGEATILASLDPATCVVTGKENPKSRSKAVECGTSATIPLDENAASGTCVFDIGSADYASGTTPTCVCHSHPLCKVRKVR